MLTACWHLVAYPGRGHLRHNSVSPGDSGWVKQKPCPFPSFELMQIKTKPKQNSACLPKRLYTRYTVYKNYNTLASIQAQHGIFPTKTG